MLWPNGSSKQPDISSPFGPRDVTQAGASSNHLGCDFTGFSTVYAVAAGAVIAVGWQPGWSGGGYMVWIQHDGYVSRSLHMVDGSARVRVGDRVSEGQAIGTMGNTAKPNPVGKHLHLEIVVNGRQVDPVPFIKARLSGAALAGSASSPASTDHEENTMSHAITIGPHSFHVAPGFIRNFNTNANVGNQFPAGAGKRGIADFTAAIVNGGTFISMDEANFVEQLDSFGIPRDKVDLKTGQVFDPVAGKKVSGGVWSEAREARALAARIAAKIGA